MLETDLAKNSRLHHMGIALVQFAQTIYPESHFQPATSPGMWVLRPNNFVTFVVRRDYIRLLLRGLPCEFPKYKGSLLTGSRGSYSTCKLRDPSQLHAATCYIKRAAKIYRAGRARTYEDVDLREGEECAAAYAHMRAPQERV